LTYLSLASSAGLRQGLFAQGSLGTSTLQTAAIPLTAMRTDKPQPYVQVVINNQVVHQAITPGRRGEFKGQTMVAVPDLKEGTQFLNGSVGAVRAGTPVKPPQGGN